MDIEQLKQIDSHRMYKIYDEWPKIAQESYAFEHEKLDVKNIDHIVFSGMGGSGAIGDMFASILSKTSIHVSIVKGYVLPKTLDENSLVINTSVSGNTIETLTVLQAAKNSGFKTISCSSGGKIEEYCNKNQLEFRKIPFYHSPRAAFVSFLFSMLNIFENIIDLKDKDVNESLRFLQEINKNISSNNITESNESLKLARWIQEIPIIYYPYGLQAAAIRFKNSLQENSKMHAITEDVIEVCHNGIVSWEKKSIIQPILLQGKEDNLKTIERWKVLKEFFDEKEIDFWEIHSVDGNILSKLVSMIYILDYSTIYKAVISKIDPTPVNSIEYLKRKLDE